MEEIVKEVLHRLRGHISTNHDMSSPRTGSVGAWILARREEHLDQLWDARSERSEGKQDKEGAEYLPQSGFRSDVSITHGGHRHEPTNIDI